MRTLSLRSAAVALLLTVAALAGGADAASLVDLPEVLPDASGVTTATLIVDTARISVAGAFDFTTRSYYWNGTARLFGPTLVLQPGGRLNVTLINRLIDDSAVDAVKAHNTFRHSNTTNIHTHGIHVDPAIDSIFRYATPGGGSLTYDIPIPADHAPGMHWYHSHAHGGSTMHIMGGLVGGMYVRWQTKDNIPSVISNLKVHRLLIQMQQFAAETLNGVTTQDCGNDAAGFNPFKTYSFAELEAASGSLVAHNPTYYVTDRTFFTVNGQYRPTISMAPGESRLIPLVYAAGSKNVGLIFPTGCTAVNLAYDGVYFNGAPRNVSYLMLTAATRVEFVLTCSTAGTHTVRYTINGDINNLRTTGGDPLFYVEATGSTQTPVTLPATLATITRPTYLNDMRSLTTTDTSNTISVSQGGAPHCRFWMGMGSDCAAATQTPAPVPGAGPPRAVVRQRVRRQSTCTWLDFPGERGTTNVSAHLFTMRVGQSSEWKLVGLGANPHPLHIHVNHFQIISFTGTDAVLTPWMQVGDWRDTVPLLAGTITVRFTADTFPGETIVHCHELNHEDKGLMSSFLILPSLTATTSAPTTTTTTSAPDSLATTSPRSTSGAASLPLLLGSLLVCVVVLGMA